MGSLSSPASTTASYERGEKKPSKTAIATYPDPASLSVLLCVPSSLPQHAASASTPFEGEEAFATEKGEASNPRGRP